MADLKKLFGAKKETAHEEAEPKASESPAQADTQAAPQEKPKLGFLQNARVGTAAAKAVSKPAPAAVVPESLDDLANIDVSTINEVGTREKELVTFPDMIEATAPIRELPADLDKTQRQFVDLMDSVFNVIHEPDLLGPVVKNIMIELKSQPHLMKLVADEDIQTWIRAMRETMGLAKIKKAEKKTTRGSSRSKKVDADMLADLADLGISIGDGGE